MFLRCIGVAITLFSVASVPLASAQAATATLQLPATQPKNSYFPVAAGTTWKYLVTSDEGEKSEKPYVQTLTVAGTLRVNGLILSAIGDELYLVQDDGVYLYGHQHGQQIQPLGEPLHFLPAKLYTGEAWNVTDKSDSLYSTCLGHQTIKTEGGDFVTECIYTTSPAGNNNATQRQVYRYFARDVGLVRETVTEKIRSASGSVATTEITRDLVAFIAAVPAPAQDAPKLMAAIGTASVQGDLLDAAGQPLAQVSFVLNRLDKPNRTALQTDVSGHFIVNGLDPAGVYSLSVAVPNFAPTDAPLHSADGQPLQFSVKLQAENTPATSDKDDDPFATARHLAATGNHAAAIAKYDEAYKQSPTNASILAYRALSHLALNQIREADDDSEAALRLNDKEPIIWETAGQVKIAEKQYNQGRALFDKAAQLSPKTAGAIYTDLAAALGAQNDASLDGDIQAALKSAISANPPSPEALFQLGQAYANNGNQQGVTYLKKYLEVTAKLPADQQNPEKIQLAKQLIRALESLK